MNVDIQDVSSCKKTLKIEIPAEDVNAEFKKAYEEVRTTVPVPGFRRGRAPRSVLRMRFGDYVRGEVIEKLVPSAFEDAVKDAELEILRSLDLEDISPPIDEMTVKEGEPIGFEVTVDVKPEIVLPNLEQLEVDKREANVVQEDVDEYLQQLRDERASFVPIEDRPLQEGDFVTVDISATSDGESVGNLEAEQVLEVGRNMEIPELAEHLMGMKTDDEKDFSMSFPSDYQADNEDGWQHDTLAGKEVNFHVNLYKIMEKHLPPLNDDFAKDLGEDDLQHLNAGIWSSLVESRKREQRDKQESDLMEQLLEKSEFEVPEFLVEDRAKILMRFSRQQPGASQDEPTEEELSQYRSSALSMVKRVWILDEIAKQEEVEVSDEETDAEVGRIAAALDRDPQKYRRLLEDTNRIESIESSIRESKLFDVLIEKASARRTLIV